MPAQVIDKQHLTDLKDRISCWSQQLGFDQVGVCDTELLEAEKRLLNWLANGYHGEMGYMSRHGTRRSRPQELIPGTLRIISVRMNYFPADAAAPRQNLNQPLTAYVARYALGRDYHKLMRRRLQKLANQIRTAAGAYDFRAFVDSGPVLERAAAERAGIGWIGKNTNLIDTNVGSWFFIGELYTNLPLPVDRPADNHCGTCARCIAECPTGAIVGPYEIDARRCISYLTIELKGPIPVDLRPLIGNRIYGCDDCQIVCPWNRVAVTTREKDFSPRHGLDTASLTRLFNWTEDEFLQRTEGSPIRRIGFARWLRNIAVALGNSEPRDDVIGALRARQNFPSELVGEHVTWALDRLSGRTS